MFKKKTKTKKNWRKRAGDIEENGIKHPTNSNKFIGNHLILDYIPLSPFCSKLLQIPSAKLFQKGRQKILIRGFHN